MVKKEIRGFIVNNNDIEKSIKEDILSVIDNLNEKSNIIDETYNNIRIFMEFCKGVFSINNKNNDQISVINTLMNKCSIKYKLIILIRTQVNIIFDILYIINYLDKIYIKLPVILQRRVICAIDYFNIILTNITCSKILFDKLTYFKKNKDCKRIYNLKHGSFDPFKLEKVTKNIIEEYLINDLRMFYIIKNKFKYEDFNKIYNKILLSILFKDKWIKIMDNMYSIPCLPDPSDFLIFYEKKKSASLVNRTYSIYSIKDDTTIIKSYPKLPSVPYSEAVKFNYISKNTLNNISNRTPFKFVKGLGAVFTKRLKVEEVIPSSSYSIESRSKLIEDPYLDYEIIKSNFSSSRYDKKLNTKKDKHNPYFRKNKKKIKKRLMSNRKNKFKNGVKTHADSSFIDHDYYHNKYRYDNHYDDDDYDDDDYYCDDYIDSRYYSYDDDDDNSHNNDYDNYYYDSYDDNYY
jgi:hypothetical protein